MADPEGSGRPVGYRYVDILKEHMGGDLSRVFDGQLIYPRQLEIHLPGDGVKPCDFECYYCQGRILRRPLGNWEEAGLRLLEKIAGRVDYQIYGGAYTEPMMNPWLFDYLEMTKRYGSSFGIHTSGSRLLENEAWSVVAGLADSVLDYVSISLDAGCRSSHSMTKHCSEKWWSRIIGGIRALVCERGSRDYPVVRICYLMNGINCRPEEIAGMVALAKDLGVDSLRFSVPYALYGWDFERVKVYRDLHEVPFGERCAKVVAPFLSAHVSERPFVFWHPPQFQDVLKMTFSECIYSYYQITLGADGDVYRCSSTASPSFPANRLGRITDDLEEFEAMVVANHNPEWNAATCFEAGARCNRIALEINEKWNEGKK